MISQARRICFYATLLTMAFGTKVRWVQTGHGKWTKAENKAEDIVKDAKFTTEVQFELADISNDFLRLEGYVAVSMENVPVFEEPKVELTDAEIKEHLNRLHQASVLDGAGALPAGVPPMSMEVDSILKIDRLANNTKYNKLECRVLGYHKVDGKLPKDIREIRWNVQIAYDDEPMILAIKPANLDKTDSNKDKLCIGDTVRFQLGGNVDEDWQMGLVTKCAETVTVLLSNGGKIQLNTQEKIVVRVTPKQIATMNEIDEKTQELRDSIEIYIGHLNNGHVMDMSGLMKTKMEDIMRIYDNVAGIDWRRAEMDKKLKRKLVEMEAKRGENKEERAAMYAMVRYVSLNEHMTFKRAYEKVNKDKGLVWISEI